MRKTKIICTIGPASESEEKLRELMLAGMNVARFNFSHGSQMCIRDSGRGVKENLKPCVYKLWKYLKGTTAYFL